MRGTVGKRIRREVYGEMSSRSSAAEYVLVYGAVRCVGLRGEYQEAKREWRRGGEVSGE